MMNSENDTERRTARRFAAEARGVYLLQSEKGAMKRRILGRAPAPAGLPALFLRWRFAYALAALVVLIGGAVPLSDAAQRSAPGDMLYALELAVVEPVEAMLIISPEARAAYYADRLEERFSELESVARSPESETFTVPVAKRVREHALLAVDAAEDIPSGASRITFLTETLAVTEALDEAIATLSDDPDAPDAGVPDAAALVSETLSEEVGSYAADAPTQALITDVRETVGDIGELVGYGSDSVLDAYVERRLADVAEEVARQELGDALLIAADTKAEVLKQQYLSDFSAFSEDGGTEASRDASEIGGEDVDVGL